VRTVQFPFDPLASTVIFSILFRILATHAPDSRNFALMLP
jgi:hypothetical protein